jgi:glycosyltransferase involved in cell wall biosynthesis
MTLFLKKIISSNFKKNRVLHVHGVWSAPQFFSLYFSNKYNSPCILTSHGMLQPWLWKNQGLFVYIKKNIYWVILGFFSLKKVKYVHAITPREFYFLKQLFPKKNIFLIPNAINLDEFFSKQEQKIRKEITFVGRLEESKGVHLLIEAFALLSSYDGGWILNIIGPVWSVNYKNYLIAIIEKNCLSDSVIFHDFKFGSEKENLIRKSWVTVLPSYTEAIGLVNLESAAMYTPTITTFQTGLDDWEEGGGILCNPSVDSLFQALQKTCSWSINERLEKGLKSRKLIEGRYSWDSILPMWIKIYNEASRS